jgi:hypothetical protein
VCHRFQFGWDGKLLTSLEFSFFADSTVHGLGGGISTKTFQLFLLKMMEDWQIIDVYRDRAAEAIEFQYTYWPDPDNRTARGQEFINVCNVTCYEINK